MTEGYTIRIGWIWTDFSSKERSSGTGALRTDQISKKYADQTRTETLLEDSFRSLDASVLLISSVIVERGSNDEKAEITIGHALTTRPATV